METFNFTVAYTVSTATLDRLVETAVDQVVSELSGLARVNTDGVRDLCRDLIVNRLASTQAAGESQNVTPAAPNPSHVRLADENQALPLFEQAPAVAAQENPAQPAAASENKHGTMITAGTLWKIVNLLNNAEWQRVEKTGSYSGANLAFEDNHAQALAFWPDSTPERIYIDHHHPLIQQLEIFKPWIKTTTALAESGVIIVKKTTVTNRFMLQGQMQNGLAFRLDALREHGFKAALFL